MENAPCVRTFQYRSEPGGLRKPQTSAHVSGMDPGLHSGVRPGGVGKAQSVNASSIVLMLFLLRHRHAVPLKSPATQVNHLLRILDCTESEDELLGDVFLLGVNVVDM